MQLGQNSMSDCTIVLHVGAPRMKKKWGNYSKLMLHDLVSAGQRGGSEAAQDNPTLPWWLLVCCARRALHTL